MMPRPFVRLAVAASLAAALTACGDDSEAAHAVDDSVDTTIDVPSEAELEAEAEQAIDASNADEQFDKLKSEIESGS